MQRRRCTYTQNSFLASRTLVVHFPLRGASVTAGPRSLFQDQRSFSHWPLLLQNTDFQAPSPGKNHDSGGPKWNPESALSETTLAVLLHTRVWGLPGNITPAPLCSPASFHPGPVSSHCWESQRVTQRTLRPHCPPWMQASQPRPHPRGWPRVCWGQGPTLRAWEASWQKEGGDPQGTH